MVAQDTARNDGGWGHAFDCGIVTPSAFPETFRGEAPLADVCHRLLRDGFYRALEIVPILDMAGRRGVADAAQTAGVTLVSVAAIPYVLQRIRPGSSDPTVWEDSLARAMRLVDDACEMGIRLQQVTCGPDPGPGERTAARRRGALFFERLCEYASTRRPDAPLAFTIEPTDRDVQLKGLIGPTAEAVEVIGTVRRSWPNIGLTLDLAHIPQVGETMEQAVETGKDFLDHVHLANTVLQPGHPQYGDTHPQFGVEGGEFEVPDIARFLRVIWRAGFFKAQSYGPRPVVSAEVRPGPGESPDLVEAQTRHKLLEAFEIVDWSGHAEEADRLPGF